ncbi:tetratricopeptide repeat protein [Oceanivirga miroungae]|uniref:Uncharacterized protein n=1 Tax=Oceanivirga miroungae TaxID=1130046 RepID=A0A6I8M8B8_9FUSO|nr:hypothetical protein [Oceanivirga miroungae]VWL85054.1 hypothetical protein OMES3154_00330 [Oceanivirga miroungae]
MFSFFKKKKKDSEIVEKEYIVVVDEDGKAIELEKYKWFNENFKPYIEKNKLDSLKVSDMIGVAINYNVKEVIDYAIEEYDRNPNINNLNNLFKAYEINNLNEEAIKLYEETAKEGLTSYMYYDLAILKEKMNKDDIDALKYLHLSFGMNNDSEKTIDKLISYLKERHDMDKVYNLLKDLNNHSHSWYLSKELAKMQFLMKKDNEAIESVVKAIGLSKKNEKKMYELAKILLDNKKHIEIENYILSVYDNKIENLKFKNIKEFNNIVLEYFYVVKEYEKAIEYLKELYKDGIYIKNFVRAEKLILSKKIEEKDYIRSAKIKSATDDKSNNKVKALDTPIFYKQLELKKEEKNGVNISIFPIVSEEVVGEYKEEIKNILKASSSYIFDILYTHSDANIKNAFMYNSLGPYVKIAGYTKEYFSKIKETNENLDYIISASISDVKDYNFIIEFFLYDFSREESISLLKRETSVANYKNVIMELVKEILPKMLEIKIEDIKEEDVDFINIYEEYLEIFLNINNENKNKIYTIDNVIKNLLSAPSKYKLNLVISIMLINTNYASYINEKYRNEINQIIEKNFDKKDFELNLEKIYGEADDNVK